MPVRALIWLLVLILAATGCTSSPEPGSTSGARSPQPTPHQQPEPPMPEQDANQEITPEIPGSDLGTIDLAIVTSGLTQPSGIVAAGDDSERIFIVERQGTIAIVEAGELNEQPFLDIRDRVNVFGIEQGLLGLAFHPEYPTTPEIYVNYTDLEGHTTISRIPVDQDSGLADAGTAEIVLVVRQPSNIHNGGHLAFGPDGYLYIGTGDGGPHGDPHENAQDSGTLLGAMLRIDIDSGKPYGIPDDNPFLHDANIRDEIWAVGLRNPWRYAFDSVTGDLYIPDVGEARVEEVNFQPARSPGGENYGWPIMEGTECFEAHECDMTGLTLPVREYQHDEGCAVTGGTVYRGQDLSELHGAFIHSDFCSGVIWALYRDGIEWRNQVLAQTGLAITALGHENAGEVYLADFNSGTIYKIVAV